MSYLNKLKVAVINEDIKALKSLVDQQPEYSTIEEAQEIVSYMNKATELLNKEKNKLLKEMQKIKNLQKFNSQKSDQQTFNFKV